MRASAACRCEELVGCSVCRDPRRTMRLVCRSRMLPRGAPLFMRSDNGSEFVSQAILTWIHQAGITTALNDPGKPWQNGTDESFNGKFRDECLSLE